MIVHTSKRAKWFHSTVANPYEIDSTDADDYENERVALAEVPKLFFHNCMLKTGIWFVKSGMFQQRQSYRSRSTFPRFFRCERSLPL